MLVCICSCQIQILHTIFQKFRVLKKHAIRIDQGQNLLFLIDFSEWRRQNPSAATQSFQIIHCNAGLQQVIKFAVTSNPSQLASCRHSAQCQPNSTLDQIHYRSFGSCRIMQRFVETFRILQNPSDLFRIFYYGIILNTWYTFLNRFCQILQDSSKAPKEQRYS